VDDVAAASIVLDQVSHLDNRWPSVVSLCGGCSHDAVRVNLAVRMDRGTW